MPIYEYKCKKCDHFFEELVSLNQESPVPCPECGAKKTEKQLSLIGGFFMGKPQDSTPASCSPGTDCASKGSCPMGGECG